MSLYALGDLHLHFSSELKSEAQKTSPVWKDHESRFREYCRETVRDTDTLMLLGDHTWGHTLRTCEEDLRYIADLPGRKILLRGNHDHFWEVKKTRHLNERYKGRLSFLQNNAFFYEDIALVGTKGYTFEGPFYLDRRGRIIGWDQDAERMAAQLVERETGRLLQSFEAAEKEGARRFILFLHYPPTSILETDSAFTRLAEAYHVEQVVYAHCHGTRHFQDSIRGLHHGIPYRLASGDFLDWHPLKILD